MIGESVMPEPIVTPDPIATPAPVIAPIPIVNPIPEPDLLTKVTQFRKQITPVASPTEGILLDQKSIDTITDPVLKEAALNLHKSLQADYTRKTQAIADSRKELEAKIADMQNWSPERIQKELLNNPQFLQAAQQIAGNQTNPANSGLTNDEFSALSQKEQAEITLLKSTVNELKAVNFNALLNQTDAQLLTRFSDYNPLRVDQAIADLSRLSPHQIREHVYKSVNHDDHVQAAYEMGKQEGNKLNQEKASAIGITSGLNATTNDALVPREKGESDVSWFSRQGLARLAQLGKK